MSAPLETPDPATPPARAPADPAALRRRRSLALGWALGAFVAIIFVITLVRLQGDAANQWNYVAPTETPR